jgi:uncharacterized membrane protein YheB (UPF0754 family)
MTKTISSKEVKNELINNIKNNEEYGKDTCNRLIKVINGYGKREGFFNKIGGIFYRIWNAVKAIFGQSDWQLASKTMRNEGLKEIAEASEEEALPDHLRIKMQKFQREIISKSVDPMLNVLIKCTYLKCQSTDELSDEIGTLIDSGMEKSMKSMEQRTNKLQAEVFEYMKAEAKKEIDSKVQEYVDSGDTEFTEDQFREMIENAMDDAMDDAMDCESDDEDY